MYEHAQRKMGNNFEIIKARRRNIFLEALDPFVDTGYCPKYFAKVPGQFWKNRETFVGPALDPHLESYLDLHLDIHPLYVYHHITSYQMRSYAIM